MHGLIPIMSDSIICLVKGIYFLIPFRRCKLGVRWVGEKTYKNWCMTWISQMLCQLFTAGAVKSSKCLFSSVFRFPLFWNYLPLKFGKSYVVVEMYSTLQGHHPLPHSPFQLSNSHVTWFLLWFPNPQSEFLKTEVSNPCPFNSWYDHNENPI